MKAIEKFEQPVNENQSHPVGMQATAEQYYPARLSIMSHKEVLISTESVH